VEVRSSTSSATRWPRRSRPRGTRSL